jgi:hypothetical protein
MKLPMKSMRTQGKVQQIRKPPAGIQRPQNLTEMPGHYILARRPDNQGASQLTIQG